MSEVSALLNVPPHVLRYWETEFPALAPLIDEMGRRSYNERDVVVARRIREMLYDEQRTIAQTKAQLSNEEFQRLEGEL